MPVQVGDVIIKARNAMKDPCATLIPPSGSPPLSGTTGGSLSGTIYAQNTWLTPWGETLPSPELQLALGANNAITDAGTLVPPPGATGGRIYYGSASGAENQYANVNMGGITNITGPGIGSRVPRLNRAYLPDTDGVVNAQQIYNWLNQALVKMGVITGGVLDENGVAIPSGAAEFVMPGWWFNITDMWHDGWVVMPERAIFTWMKSLVSGVPGIASVWQNASRQILGLWPQPSPGATTTTLTVGLGLTDTLASVANSSLFRAPGLAMCEQEVFSFSSLGGASFPEQNVVTGSQFVGAGVSSVTVNFGSTPTGTIQPQVGTGWVTTIAYSGITTSTFTVTFGTPAPPGGSLMTWSVTVVPTGGSYTSLGNLVRGLGGTLATAHPLGATVTYLIFRFRGYRVPMLYNVGQSAVFMDLPPAWDEPLAKYLLARFREWEQDDDDAEKNDQKFEQDCVRLKDTQGDPTGPRQLGWVAPFVGDSQNLETLVGTILIP